MRPWLEAAVQDDARTQKVAADLVIRNWFRLGPVLSVLWAIFLTEELGLIDV